MKKFVEKVMPHKLPYPENGDAVLEAVLAHMMRAYPKGPPHKTIQEAVRDGIEIGIQIGLMMHSYTAPAESVQKSSRNG